jgi:hypothetical protein
MPKCLDQLEARIVRLVIQLVPRHARGIQGGVCEVNVGMIDECSIVGLAWDSRLEFSLLFDLAPERPSPDSYKIRGVGGDVSRARPPASFTSSRST